MNPSLVVQRLDRATALVSSAGLPIKCLAFPASGGVQAIDAAGSILSLVGATGALTATVTDAVNNGSSTALSLVHALSAGVGANGIGVAQRFILPNSLGVAGAAGMLNVSYTDATSGSEDSALGLTLQVGGVGTAVLSISAPTAGETTLTAAGSASASLNFVAAGGVVVAPPVVTTGAQAALLVFGAESSGQDAGGDTPDVLFELSRTVTFLAGAVASQFAVSIKAPTYAFAGASTITNAATLSIDTAPFEGANATITNNYALRVGAGLVGFGGNLSFTGNAPTITATDANQGITLVSNGTGTINLNSGAAGTLQLGGHAATRIGFYGHAATTQQVLPTGSTTDQVIAALQALGLVKQA